MEIPNYCFSYNSLYYEKACSTTFPYLVANSVAVTHIAKLKENDIRLVVITHCLTKTKNKNLT